MAIKVSNRRPVCHDQCSVQHAVTEYLHTFERETYVCITPMIPYYQMYSVHPKELLHLRNIFCCTLHSQIESKKYNQCRASSFFIPVKTRRTSAGSPSRVFLQLGQYRVAKVHVLHKVSAGKSHAFFSSIRDEKKL